ncbi:hypothetical protein FOA52_012366 [Chlamydomonas sp. UWO 241]|nr:hypothetical protein FOA52_012366 [Chlamydomonas sp. UWO 241]
MEADLVKVLVLEASEGLMPPHGRASGRGKVTLVTGAVYDGEWANGHMHGTGTLVFPDGLAYEGEFAESHMEGRGVLTWPSGETYEGEVLGGLRHGHGRMTFGGGSSVSYDGQWAYGARHGHGTLLFSADGAHCYRGSWEFDMKQGRGTMVYANGDSYEGEWREDVKCGSGHMSWKSKQQEYTGEWAHNLPNGVGTHIWFQRVAEPSAANHALLLMLNRYHGHFVDSKRSGYGSMHYATGARYEGQWKSDLKTGPGVFVFESGDSWKGQFTGDRPLLADGEVFAPKGINVVLPIDDVVEEEESPATAWRAVNNVVMVYNSDLRALYDMYCKRPSLHVSEASPISTSLVAAQFWELMWDARVCASGAPLVRCSSLLTDSRRPTKPLAQFRAASRELLSTPADKDYWDALVEEHRAGGQHNPRAEVLFPAFCEALVRIAHARYRALPGVERRLHTLVNTHLLGFVSKAKAHAQPPRAPAAAELWASEAALGTLEAALPGLRELFVHVCSASSADETSESLAARDAYALVSSPRAVLCFLATQCAGALSEEWAMAYAARALVEDYMQASAYGFSQRLRLADNEPLVMDVAPGSRPGSNSVPVDGEDSGEAEGAAAPNAHVGAPPPDAADEREVQAWLDAQFVFPEFVDGLVRLAHQAPWLAHAGDLNGRLQALLHAPGTGVLACHAAMLAPAGGEGAGEGGQGQDEGEGEDVE